MDKSQKEKVVQLMQEEFSNAESVFIFDYSGYSVLELDDIRSKIYEYGASLKVVKNTLASIALSGTKHEKLKDHLSGSMIFACSPSPVAVPKAVKELSATYTDLSLKAGTYAGDVLTSGELTYLATLPDLDGLRSQLLSVIMGPATKVSQVLHTSVSQVARVIDAYAKQ